jgi:AraC-like DNA-binding protein
MLYPAPHEPLKPSLWACGLSFGASASLKLLGAPPWAFVLTGTAIVFCFCLHRGVRRYADIPPLFQLTAVWPGLIDYLCLLHTCAYLLTGVWLCILPPVPAVGWAFLAVLAAFFGLQYYRIMTRSTLFIGKKKERLIKQGQKGDGYRLPVQYVDSMGRSAILFNEVVKLMETKRPFLQEDFDLDDLARMTKTNRLYLSKAINFHSGRNFNQLVNYYRVKYAIDLIKKDSGLKMSDVAFMSGFHTTVSFNMAFKLNEHTTPSEYARNLKKIT